MKSNDDTIDILGFLAFEVVHELCSKAMQIKRQWKDRASAAQSRQKFAKREHSDDDDDELRHAPFTLFSVPPGAEPPLEAWHIREAFAELQRDRALLSKGQRFAGPAGGLRRTRVFVI